jgi:hypothetical protein
MYNPTPNLPSNLYTNGAVRFDTRQVANMLYQEERIRRMQQAREQADIDKTLQNEIGKVRSADTQLVVDTYNDYKNLRSQLYNKKLKRDPVAYAEMQRLSDLKYRDLMGTIRGSIETGEREKKIADGRRSNPNNYSDDTAALLGLSTRTRFDQLGQVDYNGKKLDLRSDEPYIYSGSDFNLAELKQKAEGTMQDRHSITNPMDDKGLQFRDTKFKFGNSPQAYKDFLMSGLLERKAGRAAEHSWDNLPKGEFERTAEEFKKLNPEKWKQMGLPTAQELRSNNPDSKLENWATYESMRYAIDKAPAVEQGAPYLNAITDRKMKKQDAMDMATFNSNLRRGEIQLRNNLKNQGDKEQKASVEQWLKNTEQQAITNNDSKWTLTIGGKKIETYEVPQIPSIMQAFEKIDIYGKKVQPNALGVDKNGNYYPIFFKKKLIPANGKEPARYDGYEQTPGTKKFAVDMNLTGKSVPRNLLSPEVANALISPKGASEELDAETTGSPIVGGPEAPAAPFD